MATKKTKKKPAPKVLKPGSIDGRPRIEIDWDAFKSLCAIHATLEEIAGFFECSEDTIEKRVKEKYSMTFTDIHKRFSAKGKISLRRQLVHKAQQGDNTAMIWLSKQYLGMKERTDVQETRQVVHTIDPETRKIMLDRLEQKSIEAKKYKEEKEKKE